MSPTHVRPYRPSDLDALYEICLRTGAAGKDATALVQDPKLFGEIYAAPYGVLEPEHAFVVDDGEGRAVGYVLGALDTDAFEAKAEAEWWPDLRIRHPLVEDDDSLDGLLVSLIHHRSRRDGALLESHPSHLHIDLLPEVQGHGWGRKLMDTLFDALRADGSPGVHWGVSTRNHNAIAFYEHLGCTRLTEDPHTITFGVRLSSN